jgi:hypothetical protein
VAGDVTIGPYVAGEIPSPLTYQFLDSNGNPINLSSGYTARFEYRERDSAPVLASAAVTDAVNGRVTYTFTGAEFATAGRYTAFFWVGNGTQRLASIPIYFAVRLPAGPVPAI